MVDTKNTLFKKHYPELDFLRTIAIVLVMLMHFLRRFFPLEDDGLLFTISNWGWNGVGLFFALSGFLIGGQIIEELRAGRFSFKRFYIKRFFRIFPPYYFSILVVVIIFFLGVDDSNTIHSSTTSDNILSDIVLHIFFLQNYLTLPLLQGSLYWTLAVEEQFYILAPVLLFGTYLLSRAVFTHKSTAVAVTAIVITSTVLHYQLFLNLRAHLYLPLIFYFLVRFFREGRYSFLSLSICVFVLSFFGFPVYMIPTELLSIVVVSGVLIAANAGQWRRFISPRKSDLAVSAVLLLLALVTVAVYYNYISHAMEYTEVFSKDRDPETLATTLENFLTYASGLIGFQKFMGLLYPYAKSIIGGITIYVGLITLVFALYAVVFCRKAFFIAIFLVSLVFFLFSLGDRTPVAEFLYHYFPMMKYYRHIGHTVGVYKLFLPLMAGFGIDHLMSLYYSRLASDGEGQRDKNWSRLILVCTVTLTGIALLTGSFLFGYTTIPGQIVLFLVTLSISILVLLFILKWFIGPRKYLPIFIITCIVIQMLGYQFAVTLYFNVLSTRNAPTSFNIFDVNQYGFQQKRTLGPISWRSNDATRMVDRGTVAYTLAYNFLQWDPCVSKYRTDFLNRYMARLLQLKGGGTVSLGVDAIASQGSSKGLGLEFPKDLEFLESVGCVTSKLRLFKNVVYVDSSDEAASILQNTRQMSRLVVLEDVKTAERHPLDATLDDPFAAGTIDVFDYSANEISIRAMVTEPTGAWLYYSESWHPDWKGFVNGIEVDIARANIGFKALWLPAGENTVRLVFNNSRNRRSVQYFILLGVVATLAFFIYTAGRALVWGYPSPPDGARRED